jgi:hypothetical protein
MFLTPNTIFFGKMIDQPATLIVAKPSSVMRRVLQIKQDRDTYQGSWQSL